MNFLRFPTRLSSHPSRSGLSRRRGCKPAFRSCAIAELCFFVFYANAKDFFLATRKVALDDTNLLCTFADAAVLSSCLFYALFRNGAIKILQYARLLVVFVLCESVLKLHFQKAAKNNSNTNASLCKFLKWRFLGSGLALCGCWRPV